MVQRPRAFRSQPQQRVVVVEQRVLGRRCVDPHFVRRRLHGSETKAASRLQSLGSRYCGRVSCPLQLVHHTTVPFSQSTRHECCQISPRRAFTQAWPHDGWLACLPSSSPRLLVHSLLSLTRKRPQPGVTRLMWRLATQLGGRIRAGSVPTAELRSRPQRREELQWSRRDLLCEK